MHRRWAGQSPFLTAWFLCGLWLGTLTSCGYTLVGAPADASHPRLALRIVPMLNQTREPDLERLMTAALRHALVHSLLLTDSADHAAVPHVRGIIRRFRTFPLALDASDNVVQYRMEADIAIHVLDATGARPVLEQEVSTAAVYLVSRAATDKVREDVTAREAAIARLAQQFADQCLALLATTFF